MARKCHPREHIPLTSTSTRSGGFLRLFTLSILLLVLLVSVADATEYTVRPSRNLGMEPGTPTAGETVQEIDPIPLWLFLLLCVFPQLTAAPIEALLPLKAVGYLGYKRIRRENALESPRRLEIFNFIRKNPGLHFRALLRKTSIARGTLDYHIRRMESEGLLKAVPEKSRIHYFTGDSQYSTEEETLIIAMENDSLRKIVTQIYLNQGARIEELAKESGLSKATIYTHVKHLENLGIVRSERTGRSVRYTLADDYSRVLMKHQTNSSEPARVSV
ncbi:MULTISPECIES: winged helix-turn-helix transcriptional regulator [unclassified Methanoculleus]|uniref:winged helix-turn-helix transcriptional regulator n=1 Tax=unclassified Methanoculleus TaxID=2619537 RepID=UPI0025D053AC|nr:MULTISPECIES: winged helix-turn-helix transcriptional regulator [unclassified Methanoculleus]